MCIAAIILIHASKYNALRYYNYTCTYTYILIHVYKYNASLLIICMYVYIIQSLKHLLLKPSMWSCKLCIRLQELVEVFNNILNETNQVGWTELQTVASGSQTLLQNAERYGAYLAKTVNSTDESVVLVRENIGT